MRICTRQPSLIDHLVQEGLAACGGQIPCGTAGATGTQNNQTFVHIPHARFIAILTYKAKLAEFEVVIAEESYTSKASFLDLDALPTYDPERTEKPRERTANGRNVAYIGHLMEDASMLI